MSHRALSGGADHPRDASHLPFCHHATMTPPVQVGAVVRAPRGVGKLKGRAVVCLVEEEDETACVLWEDLAPRPVRNGTAFIVTPMVPRSKEEKESTISLSKLSPLMKFEQNCGDEVDVAQWKERGDALLRLGDGSAAIPYYEAGLAASSVLQVGSTAIISDKDEFQVAEVDYIEQGNVDVTIIGIDEEEERTVPDTEVKLCLLSGQEALQVRILLNLARCLIQVADLEDSQMSAYYRRSAAIGCSMGLAILTSVDGLQEESLQATALLLRSKAYASRSKWKLAIADAQLLTRDHTDFKEGRTWFQQLEKLVSQHQKTNQKLAKSMCEWVQNATATTDGGSVSSGDSVVEEKPSSNEKTSNLLSLPLTLFWYLFPILLCLSIHRFLHQQNISYESSQSSLSHD